MRSLMLNAALAAALSTAPFATAFAASAETGRMSEITAQLNRASGDIDVDHGLRTLNAIDAGNLQAQVLTIRDAAKADADRHGGMLTEADYASLQKQVDQLNRDISLDARS